MEPLKYTQNRNDYPYIVKFSLLIAGWFLMAGLNPAAAQTNDPLLNQQHYIFGHNIDQAWNYNTGSSNTRIAIHSMSGFTASHEDMEGARYLNPWTEWFAPEDDYASEVAGIVGANTNNGTGIAGVDWQATMKSYNVLREKQSGDDNPDATFSYDGQEYYLDTGKLNVMVNQAIQDNMDIHVFTFGVPSAKLSDLKIFKDAAMDQYLKTTVIPSFPEPDPQKPFWNALRDMVKNLGESIWQDIKNQNYTPPSNLELLRQELWKATQPENNGVSMAPAGDVQDQEQFEFLMPAAMKNHVIAVGGVSFDPSTGQTTHWPYSHEASYVDVAAAATEIVSVSGTGYSAYNNDFSSTAAATGIAAGVVSLIKAENPGLTHDDIAQILARTATDIEDPGHDPKTGHGFIDAGAAMSYVSNNEIHHKQATGSDITINNDEQVYPNIVTMSTHYLSFTGTNACCPYGELRKVTGTVNFDQPFETVPDVWLRMTSSGIDNTILADDKHWYDPYDKAFEVLSVTKNGFDFELYYWKVEYYDSAAKLVETRHIPNTSQLALDYTAVGEEALPQPLSVNITGPSQVVTNQSYTWTANTSGGTPSYTWFWYWKSETNPNWNYISSTMLPDFDFTFQSYMVPSGWSTAWLRVVVQDQDSGNEEDVYRVIVNDPALLLAEESEPLPEEFALDQNHPNPFNPATSINYQLPEPAAVTLAVYNVLGRRVATLVDGEQPAGFHTANWDGSGFASGLYFLRMQASGQSGEPFHHTRPLTLVK